MHAKNANEITQVGSIKVIAARGRTVQGLLNLLCLQVRQVHNMTQATKANASKVAWCPQSLHMCRQT